MMLYNVILLLLYWPHVRSIRVNHHVVDQLAIASDHSSQLHSNIAHHKADAVSLSPSLNQNVSAIHYENSNGFVPMISATNNHPSMTRPSKLPENKDSHQQKRYAEQTSNNVKFVLNVPDADRRLDAQNGQREFEILKVNEKIPAVANYHEFYENLRKNRENNRHHNNNNYNYHDNHHLNNKNTNYYGNKERIKQIENYLNYDNNKNYPIHENVKNNDEKKIVNKNEYQNNYNQYSVANYNLHGENVSGMRPTNPTTINYPTVVNSYQNNWSSLEDATIPKITNVHYVNLSNYDVINYHRPQTSLVKATMVAPSYKHDHEKNSSEDRYDRSEDYSDENSDYYEVTERSRRIHKSRRKPHFDSTRTLPKEHRNTDDPDEMKKANGRTKSHRGRTKASHWSDEDHQSPEENSAEASKETRYRDKSNGKNENHKEKSNAWSQVGPNVEFSPSNAFELGQIDKPNVLVPVNFNLLPVTNFDHNAAIGNSQGFGVSNAGVPNFIPTGSIVSTAAPLVSSNSPIIMQSTPSTPIKNYAYPTVSDIVVGQNSIQAPMQTLMVPQVNNKYNPNVKTYIHSTPTPMYTINPTMQTLTPMHSTVSPKAIAQVTGPQLFYSSSTVRPFYHTSVPAATNYNIVVNPYSIQGQNSPTTASSQQSNTASSSADAQQKKNQFSGNTGQFLASASLSVQHGEQSQSNHEDQSNKYYIPINHGNDNAVPARQVNTQVRQQMYPIIKNENQAQTGKTLVPAHVVPAYIQATPVPAINLINGGQAQGQQYFSVGNNILENTWKQLQHLQATEQQKYHHANNVGNRDSVSSMSNTNINTVNFVPSNEKAQLPVVGMQNVEILNPNLLPLPTQVVPQYSAAVVTTPIPIVSTTGFTASAPVTHQIMTPTIVNPNNNIQQYVDSLTQLSAQPIGQNTMADSSAYNPMNFIPNSDLIKSQILLNGKTPEPLPSSLNLVPIIPGGKFHRNTPSSQSDLVNKPKLSADLEKYAEEMFKESLRTIYNTHKWNSDKKIKNLTYTENGIDFSKLKKELESLKASMDRTKYGKEILEAHHSEPQLHTADPSRPKRPGLSVGALEELFKSNFKPSSPTSNSHSSQGSSDIKLNEYLTPPKLNSFMSSSPFIDKPKKKRQKSRPHSRPNSHNSRPSNLETSASHVTFHRRPHHNRNNYGDYRGKENYIDNYPTFTTSSPDFNIFQLPRDDHASKSDYLDFNLPRTHNLLGWLMKSKQLPPGASASPTNDFNPANDFTPTNDYNIANEYNPTDNMNNFQFYVDQNRRILERKTAFSQPSYPVPYFSYYH